MLNGTKNGAAFSGEYLLMKRRNFLTLGAVVPLELTLSGLSISQIADAAPVFSATRGVVPDGRTPHTFSFDYGAKQTDGTFASGQFMLDGAPFQICSGEMHPFRIHADEWEDRILKAKAMGLNTIGIYVMWNHVESAPGVFDFESANRNIARFITLCEKHGMWVLLRPGPYVDGEWDFGGLPPYLLKSDYKDIDNPSPIPGHGDIVLRDNNVDFMSACKRYITKLGEQIKPLMAKNGGPILMIAVENELHNIYPTSVSKQDYLVALQKLWTDLDINGPFCTANGNLPSATELPNAAIGLDGNARQPSEAARQSGGAPVFLSECYPGWLTHWGESTAASKQQEIVDTLTRCMQQGISFNMYVVHGGTNFGFTAGADTSDYGNLPPNDPNFGSGFQTNITSYDYRAPIAEDGSLTETWDACQKVLSSSQQVLPAKPAGPNLIDFPYQQATIVASIWDNLPAAETTQKRPKALEEYGQSSGFVLYRREGVKYSGAGGKLTVNRVRDFATVFYNDTYAGYLSRVVVPGQSTPKETLMLPAAGGIGGGTLDILVEGMGHTASGTALLDRKGITQNVVLDEAELQDDWATYLLPMTEDYVSRLKSGTADGNLSKPGLFFQLKFDLETPGATYIDMWHFTKGLVWVNGHALGRYWTAMSNPDYAGGGPTAPLGPQYRLFCPASFLKAGTNTVLVFDQFTTTPHAIGGRKSSEGT
jgi:beta-galactosidase